MIVTSQSSTQADGSVVLVLTTMTSAYPPLTVILPVSTGASGDQNTQHSSGSGVVAPVVGGILGGFFGLIGLVVIIWCLWYVQTQTRRYTYTKI